MLKKAPPQSITPVEVSIRWTDIYTHTHVYRYIYICLQTFPNQSPRFTAYSPFPLGFRWLEFSIIWPECNFSESIYGNIFKNFRCYPKYKINPTVRELFQTPWRNQLWRAVAFWKKCNYKFKQKSDLCLLLQVCCRRGCGSELFTGRSHLALVLVYERGEESISWFC